MADLHPVGGCKIYIGGAIDRKNADFVAADFTGVTWVEIDSWKSMGGLSDAAAAIENEIINSGRTVKQKGTMNASNMENVFGQLVSDPGQLAVYAASKEGDNYAFKVELNDGDVSNSERLFIALVMSATEPGGTANVTRDFTTDLAINSNLVRVEAV